MLLLAVQAALIVYARFDPMRYFCWAPHDAQSVYRIDVRIGDRVLTRAEVTDRYRIDGEGRDPRAIEHVIRLVRQRETTYGAPDRASVVIRYRTNGGPEQVWRWSPR